MERKPNQVIDEITQVIYPPAEAIVGQLSTIKAIIPSTIRMYEDTEDIHTIFPNLDMIQRAIDYLRGAPMQPELKPLPEDILNPTLISYSSNVNITIKYTAENEYDMSVVGTEIEPHIHYPELFGDQDIEVVTLELGLPVICGHQYEVSQINPILAIYQDDPSIQQDENEQWIKVKTYDMDKDTFEYAFLTQGGRNDIKITIKDLTDDSQDPITFNINTHIHFKGKDETADEDTGSNG